MLMSASIFPDNGSNLDNSGVISRYSRRGRSPSSDVDDLEKLVPDSSVVKKV